ncbi:MAG: hypothetical protein IPL71_20900 [Anaerolineales bacterium]|uniref:hypothetical protein n=1 Tax=Candidatus Villigracilis proximus TaxID=3140683 RepID=UPI003136D15A|nr:hypothetical protein [Anaerolineales bacterium]
MAVRAFVMTGIMAALWWLKDDRFKPVYAGLFGAAVVAFLLCFYVCSDQTMIRSVSSRSFYFGWRADRYSFA